MKTLITAFLSLVLFSGATASVHAQGSQWEMLNNEAMSLLHGELELKSLTSMRDTRLLHIQEAQAQIGGQQGLRGDGDAERPVFRSNIRVIQTSGRPGTWWENSLLQRSGWWRSVPRGTSCRARSFSHA